MPEVVGTDDNNSSNEPPSKHPKLLLSRVALLLEEKRKEQYSASCLDLSAEEKKIQKYSGDNFSQKMDDDPFNFWKDVVHYPIIGPIACDILCVPASTAPVKRDFLQVGSQL